MNNRALDQRLCRIFSTVIVEKLAKTACIMFVQPDSSIGGIQEIISGAAMSVCEAAEDAGGGPGGVR